MLFSFLSLNISLAQDVSVPDTILAAAIRAQIGNSITQETMLNLTSLSVYNDDDTNPGITDLTGLEYAKNLQSLQAGNNAISDISALSGLTKLTWLGIAFKRYL